jgi:hypothetical protein
MKATASTEIDIVKILKKKVPVFILEYLMDEELCCQEASRTTHQGKRRSADGNGNKINLEDAML